MAEDINHEPERARRRGSAPERGETAAAVRMVVRTRRSAVLGTALATGGGWPYTSLVTVACDTDGSPITLFSTLSDHTRNLDVDARASLLFEDASRRANPQTGPRATLLGRSAPDDEPRLRRRFLALHPGAAMYAQFADFRIFRMSVERVHWVGGFAQARWLGPPDVLCDAGAARAIAEAETDVLQHMNTDHAAAVDLYAARLLRRGGQGWRMVAVDPEGCDLARGETTFARLPFPRPATDAQSLRAILIELATAAREAPARPRSAATRDTSSDAG